jgi:transcriptional regulator with XRE-family HTH domain
MDPDIDLAQQQLRQYLSANLKIWRGKRELSQEALAIRAGFHRTYVSQIERHLVNLTLENLAVLAYVLEVPASTLLAEPSEDAVPLRAGRKRILVENVSAPKTQAKRRS